MRALTKLTLILACFFLLLLPACSQPGRQAEPQPVSAAATDTAEALQPAPETEVEPVATPAAETLQPAEAGDSGPALEAAGEEPAAEARSPEPTAEPTAAPSATPQIAVTQTGEAPTPQVTLTPEAAVEPSPQAPARPASTEAAAGAQDGEEEEPSSPAAPIDEAVTGAVMGNSGTTAELVERGIALDVTGLASTYAWLVVPISEGVVDPLPRHVLLTFDDDDPGEMMAEDGRRMVVFPVRPYLALYTMDGQSDVDEQVARLRELIATAPERTRRQPGGADLPPPGDWMPLLPPVEDGRLLTWEQFADVDFASGRGVRFLSDYTGAPAYYYQGLSEGERYYVSLVWPLVGEEVPQLEALDGLVASFTIGATGEP